MKGIFVFGSNLRGHHMGGAAKDAIERFGAVWGTAEGPSGSSYAIPTLDIDFSQRLTEKVRESVRTFLAYAKEHPELYFFVTRIGCGIAGFKDSDIAPMFWGAPDNCEFDPLWVGYGLTAWKERL